MVRQRHRQWRAGGLVSALSAPWLEVTAAEEGMFILAYFAAGILAIPLWLGLAAALASTAPGAAMLACAAFNRTVP